MQGLSKTNRQMALSRKVNIMKNPTLLFALLLIFQTLFAVESHVDSTKLNIVKFISDAPIENIEGITNKIDGYIYWDDDDVTAKSQMYFEIDLNSLDTGIGLRNRHMRDNYLETDKFPITWFKGKVVNLTKKTDSEFDLSADGTIFIHGVERPISVEGKMTKNDKSYRIQTNFEIELSDFNIKIPSLMFYKINETIKIELDFYVVTID